MYTRIVQTLATQFPANANTPVLAPVSGRQLSVYSLKCINRSGGACDMGVFRKFGPKNWLLGAVASNVLSDITAAVQAGTASQIVSTTNNDGYLVSSKEAFNLIGLKVSQAQAGTPTYTYQYWNGSTWATLITIAVPASYGSGNQLVVFATPVDWVPGGGTVTGLDATKYNILVRATAAPSTAVQVNDAWVAQMLDFFPGVADKASATWQTSNVELPLIFESQDALLPYFSSANTANMVTAQYLVQW